MPSGMNPARFDALEDLFSAYERGEFEGLATDAAIRAFAISHNLPG